MPETSIIIRAFNEERHLPSLFDGLATQEYSDFETIVVDSGSFDETRSIAAARADHLVPIASSDFTFGYALNAGIEHSTGTLIVIVSAHTYPQGDNWLGGLIAPLRHEQTAMVYGCQRGIATSKFSECSDFERTFGDTPAEVRPPAFFANNANSAIRRDLWLRHRFDESLPGLEDIEWAKYWIEQGYRVLYEPRACIYHIHHERWPQVRRRYYREGQAAKWIGIRRRRDIPVECWKEMRYLAGDVVRAARQGELAQRVREIARFRFEKLRGTAAGIYDGALTKNPLERGKLLFDRSHRAVVIHGPGRATLEEVELPALKPSEVLIRVAYQGICHTDIEILDGSLGYYKSGLAKYPIIPGHEFSGTVVKVGSRVNDLFEQDQVVIECIQGCGECPNCARGDGIGCRRRTEVGVIGKNGGYAEYVISSSRFVHRLPATVSLKQACLCEPIAVCLKGLRRLQGLWQESDRPHVCAVIGGGPIGHLVCRLLALRGHSVTVFDQDARRLALFEGTAIRTSARIEKLDAFDAIVEATGDPDALDTVIEGSGTGSTILLLGLPYARRELSFETLVGFDKALVGSVGSEPCDFAEAAELLPQIDTRALTSVVLPFSDFAHAWQLVRRRDHLKVILQIDGAFASESRVHVGDRVREPVLDL